MGNGNEPRDFLEGNYEWMIHHLLIPRRRCLLGVLLPAGGRRHLLQGGGDRRGSGGGDVREQDGGREALGTRVVFGPDTDSLSLDGVSPKVWGQEQVGHVCEH